MDRVGVVMAELVDDLLNLLVFAPKSGLADDLLEPGNRM